MPDKFTLSQVNLHYDAFHALKDVNLNLPEKAITAFIGPSGCGKSTLLKSLNRMNDLIPGCKITGTIARALAVKPEVLLMDEPTSALDPISTGKIEELVMQLKKDYTIIMVTHNMQQALRVSDRTAFFLLGEVVEDDATDKLFSTPKDKRTEDYITGRFG